MTRTLPAAGTVARFDQPNGDQYIGEIVRTNGNLVTLANYSAWYTGDSAPYNSPYIDDEVRFATTPKTVICEF